MAESLSWNNSRESAELHARIENPKPAADFELSERYTNPRSAADDALRRRVDEEARRQGGFFDGQSGRLLVIAIISIFLLWMYIAVI